MSHPYPSATNAKHGHSSCLVHRVNELLNLPVTCLDHLPCIIKPLTASIIVVHDPDEFVKRRSCIMTRRAFAFRIRHPRVAVPTNPPDGVTPAMNAKQSVRQFFHSVHDLTPR